MKGHKSADPAMAGLMLFLAGSIVLMGIVTAEMFYPAEYNYTTARSMISDLGATEPPNSIITQPSATIFNASMMIAGVLLLAGTYLVFRAYRDPIVLAPMGIFAIGVLGVGIFPGNMNPMHPISALMAFVGGGLAAIASCRVVRSPYRFVAVVPGVITLFFLVTSGYFMPTLGGGGVERWIAYPVVIWTIGLGGYLLGAGPRATADTG